jgi:NAD(P)-dependent dehydrogenase (short-subunit alcohol dehydrogenase family)
VAQDSGKLEGKVAVVTGAGSSGPGFGTGKAISVLFAREGAKVLLVDKFEDRAEETRGIIEGEGGEASVFAVDLEDMAAGQQVVDEAVARYGTVDILVNNAALGATKHILETSDELYQQIIAINLTAPFMLCRAVIPVMAEHGGGAIVNIVSIAAMRGQGGSGAAAYAASKGGLISLTTDLADAVGGQGIRVNAVAPGIIDTPMRDASIRLAGLEPGDIDLSFKTSLGIEGDAWDIARAALFVAGPDGRFVTGVLLPIDGGTTARSH